MSSARPRTSSPVAGAEDTAQDVAQVRTIRAGSADVPPTQPMGTEDETRPARASTTGSQRLAAEEVRGRATDGRVLSPTRGRRRVARRRSASAPLAPGEMAESKRNHSRTAEARLNPGAEPRARRAVSPSRKRSPRRSKSDHSSPASSGSATRPGELTRGRSNVSARPTTAVHGTMHRRKRARQMYT